MLVSPLLIHGHSSLTGTCTLGTKLAQVSLAGPELGYIPKLTWQQYAVSSVTVNSASSCNSTPHTFTSSVRGLSYKKVAAILRPDIEKAPPPECVVMEPRAFNSVGGGRETETGRSRFGWAVSQLQ